MSRAASADTARIGKGVFTTKAYHESGHTEKIYCLSYTIATYTIGTDPTGQDGTATDGTWWPIKDLSQPEPGGGYTGRPGSDILAP